ncbi:hypothetical protein [Streptomyces sp. bgisy153]|uniref:hypothetical protein n=1 Tax=Streptomyces sp. bgisy153 TaxID=3413793 RepID=UPI003D7271A3
MASRDERIESYYHESAWDLAERIVDLEDGTRKLEGDCIRLSEELHEARATNEELAKDVHDARHWEAVAGRMRAEIERLRGEVSRYESAWKSARRRASRAMGAWRFQQRTIESLKTWRRKDGDVIRELVVGVAERSSRLNRYRLAWLSARRRAADEANFGMEALELKQREITRLRALLDERESTHVPRLEFAGFDEDGEVWRVREER